MQPEDYAFLYELEENFWWFAGMSEITATVLDRVMCAPARPLMILDAGCGTGGMLSWLERYAGNGCITGIDLSSIGLGFCRTRGHNMLAQASVTDLPFVDSTFDLVTSFDIWEQLPGDLDESAAREMLRVLKPGGVTFVRVPAYEWMKSGHDRALATQRRYGLNELVGKMSNAGFKIRRATYANTMLFPLAVTRRLFLQRIGLANRGSEVKPMPASLGWLNRILLRALRTEARLLNDPERAFPFGLSAICLAEKPRP